MLVYSSRFCVISPFKVFETRQENPNVIQSAIFDYNLYFYIFCVFHTKGFLCNVYAYQRPYNIVFDVIREAH